MLGLLRQRLFQKLAGTIGVRQAQRVELATTEAQLRAIHHRVHVGHSARQQIVQVAPALGSGVQALQGFEGPWVRRIQLQDLGVVARGGLLVLEHAFVQVADLEQQVFALRRLHREVFAAL